MFLYLSDTRSSLTTCSRSGRSGAVVFAPHIAARLELAFCVGAPGRAHVTTYLIHLTQVFILPGPQ